MNRKIIAIIICMLMCVTASAVAGTKLVDKNGVQPVHSQNNAENRDMWDVQFEYDAGGPTASLYLVGVGFDGTYFYCPEFSSPTIYRFAKDGTYLNSFTITGVPNLIDLTYDGTYFYGQGQTPTNVIYKMDFTTHTLIGTIPSPHAAWNIAYDADHDGFWIGQWQTSLSLISRTGSVLTTITPVPESILGIAWDPWTEISGYVGPFLWIFTGTSTGSQGIIKVIDLATKTIVPGVQHNVATELGLGMAGGLEFTTDYQEGLGTLYGMIQGADPLNDYIFGYEITTTITNEPPLTPAAPSGPNEGFINIEYQFNASTTDPEGDNISYMFDWGDSHNSGWVGPYASGAPAHASHIWTDSGVYQVKVKAKDENNAESNWSSTHTITIISGPVLKIGNITGGLFKIKATIKNIGEATANHIEWTINLTGGFVLSGKLSSGPILSLAPGSERTITSKPIIGFGKTVITITATVTENSAMKQQNATLLLFFIKIK